jgi:hypothetical protein
VGRDAVAEGGTDLYFLGDGGIYEIGQTTESKLQSNPAPITAGIEGTMKRVHWMYAGNAQMVCHEDRLMCAVPLDGATYNNAILVYNLTTKQWEGIWTAAWLRLKAFVQVVEDGRKKLGFVNGVGGELRVHWWGELSDADQREVAAANVQVDLQGLTDGALLVMGAGKQDYIYGYSSWIEDEILTRGYKLSPMQQMKGIRMTLDLATWNPRFDVFVRRAGRSTEDRVANDVRRGFERDLLPEATDARLGAWPISPYLAFATIGCDTLAHSGGGFDYVTLPATFTYQHYGLNPLTAEEIEMLREKRVMGFAWYKTATVNEPLLITVSDAGTGQAVTRIVETTYDAGTDTFISTGTGVIWLERETNRYPLQSPLIMTVQFLNTGASPIMPFGLPAYNGNFVQVHAKSGPGDVVPSRRQRIFGAEEVLWAEGSAPAELNGRGHNDYAWRVGAGLGSGVILGGTERYPHVYRLTKRGEFVQARVSNIRGYSALHGVALHGQVGRRGKGDRAG